jgi:hypothetical protein
MLRPAKSSTKWITIKRSILLGGEVAEEGSIVEVARSLAADLIGQGSAAPLNFVARVLRRLWFFRDGRKRRATTAPGFRTKREAIMLEKALIERAMTLGVQLEFDSPLLFAKLTKTGDPGQSAIITEIGKSLRHVRRVLGRRATAARAKNFVGARIWSAEYGEGVLELSTDDELQISIQVPGDRTRRMIGCDAAALLIVLDDWAEGASSPGDDEPISDDLLERAANLAVRLKFDCGLIFAVVKWAEQDDPRQGVIIPELAKSIGHVRRLVERHAVATRGKNFVGARIWFEGREGVLAEIESAGGLLVAMPDSQMLTANAESLLFLLDADGASSRRRDESSSEQPRKGILERLHRGSRKD